MEVDTGSMTIFIVTFIGSLLLFLTLVPHQIWALDYEGHDYDPQYGFSAEQLEAFVETFGYRMNGTLQDGDQLELIAGIYHLWKDIGGHTFIFQYDNPPSSNGVWSARHVLYVDLILFRFSTGSVPMDIYHNGILVDDGTLLGLTGTELDTHYAQDDLQYLASSSHGASFNAIFGFNETAYATPSIAFDASDLYFHVGLNWSQINTGRNAWALMGQILRFNMPDTHPFLNALLAIPLWSGIIIVSAVMLWRTIEAIKPL